MASVILTNWTVYYADDAGAGNGYKQITWTGAGGPAANTNTVNELYSALADLFSIAAQNNANDTIPIQAVTPTVYNIGAFDAGDLEPWFIDPVSVQHLTGGSIQTVGWERSFGGAGDIGIVKITRSGSTNIVAGDIGATITNTTGGDDGWLLYIEGNTLWIRPATNGTGDDWDTTGGTNDLVCNSHTDTQATAGVSGERLWSNIYSLGTLASNTDIYVVQNSTKLTAFWSSGHIDRLILVNDGFDAGLIDRGYLSIYARRYATLYDNYTLDASGGGRNAVPLATFSDSNNTTGLRQFTATGVTGTFDAGNYIYVGASWAAATKKGVLTAVSGNDLTYYLIGDLTDFALSDAITEYTGTANDATGTAGTPSNVGPAANTGITATFGQTYKDLNNGNGTRPYDVTIECNSKTIEEVYERLKYLTRVGQTTDIDSGSQSIIGEQYRAVGDIRFNYDGGSGTFAQGDTITDNPASGDISGKLTSLIDNGDNTGTMVLRDVIGTFSNDLAITNGTATASVNGTPDEISPNKQAPFGSFAGGTFFGARGVFIENMDANDTNSYQLIDSTNTAQIPPSTITISVTSLSSGDRVVVLHSTNETSIYKSMFTAAVNTAGSTTFVVTGTIPSDTPAKTGPSGVVRIIDVSDSSVTREIRHTYTSWSGSTFSGLSPALVVSYASGSDTAYVPYIDKQVDSTTASVSIVYVTDRPIITRVRRYQSTTGSIIPFTISGTIGTAGYTTAAIRTSDTIVS